MTLYSFYEITLLKHDDMLRDMMKRDHLADAVIDDLLEERSDQHGVYIPALAWIGQHMLHIATRLIKLYGDDDGPAHHPHWTQNRSTR